MAYLNVIYFNHFDLTWRRPRYQAGKTNGYNIKPYAELQECQIDRALEFVRAGGCYDIEQTTTMREYLERNPDLYEEIKGYIAEGRINLLGGGESVIDYNLPDGETLIRNHLYSRRWIKKEFDVEPKLAMCPDTFGLSSGMPTLFRELGYRGILEFDRVFKNHKPYWKGISGDIVALDTNNTIASGFKVASYVKCRVCDICGGTGCPACKGTGIYLNECPGNEQKYADIEAHIRNMEIDRDCTLVFTGEECMVPENIHSVLKMYAGKYNRQLRYIGCEQLALEEYSEILANVDSACAEQIDERAEGNPVATGCYTSRIRIKQMARRLESMFRSAERFSVMVVAKGIPYPKKTFEYWWRKLLFTVFHDSIPSSHSDDASTELFEIGRQIETALSRIIYRALKKLSEDICVKEGQGIPFIAVNPLEFDVKNAKLTGTFDLDKFVHGGKVVLPNGKETPCLSLKHSNIPESKAAVVEFIGDLPAFGYSVFRFIPDEHVAGEKEIHTGFVMENEALKVTFDEYGISSVFDKINGHTLAVAGTFSPYLADDPGNLWGRNGDSLYRERADYPCYNENMLPAREYEHRLTYETKGDTQIVRAYVNYARDEKRLHRLNWLAEFMLSGDSKELKVKIKATFDAEDLRLQTMVVLPQQPKEGKLKYEIPLGTIKRGEVFGVDKMLGVMDEWAALRYVVAEMDGYSVLFCNNGTPGHRIENDTIVVSMLRTPTQMCCGFGIDGAIDRTENTFEYILTAGGNDVDNYRTGLKFNTQFPVISTAVKGGVFEECGSFIRLPNGLPLLTLKAAESGDDFIARYIGISEPCSLYFGKTVERVSVLEDRTLEKSTFYKVEPYKLLTLKLNSDMLRG